MNIKYIGYVELEIADTGLNRFAVCVAQTSVSSSLDASALRSAASHVRSFAETWNSCLQPSIRKGVSP
jgi:hypothetical protein